MQDKLNEPAKPALVCTNINGKINHVDIGHCYRPFIFFGRWKPKYECGDKRNIHTCEALNEFTQNYIKSCEEK